MARVRASHAYDHETGTSIPGAWIRNRSHTVFIPHSELRQLADDAHDIADQHDNDHDNN